MTIALRQTDLEPRTPVFVRQSAALQAKQPTTERQAQRLDTGIHPVVIAIPLAAVAWFLIVSWLAFGGGEMNPILGVIAVFWLLFLGLFAGGGARACHATAERTRRRGFRAFLHGNVDIATGRITGREAFWQITTMPLASAIGFTVIAIIATTV